MSDPEWQSKSVPQQPGIDQLLDEQWRQREQQQRKARDEQQELHRIGAVLNGTVDGELVTGVDTLVDWVVNDDLVYVVPLRQHGELTRNGEPVDALVVRPRAIVGYRGQTLEELDIRSGTKLQVCLDANLRVTKAELLDEGGAVHARP